MIKKKKQKQKKEEKDHVEMISRDLMKCQILFTCNCGKVAQLSPILIRCEFSGNLIFPEFPEISGISNSLEVMTSIIYIRIR